MMPVLVNKGVVIKENRERVLLNTNVGPGRFHRVQNRPSAAASALNYSYYLVRNISQGGQRCTVWSRYTIHTVDCCRLKSDGEQLLKVMVTHSVHSFCLKRKQHLETDFST